jgi:hypothetical protein
VISLPQICTFVPAHLVQCCLQNHNERLLTTYTSKWNTNFHHRFKDNKGLCHHHAFCIFERARVCARTIFLNNISTKGKIFMKISTYIKPMKSLADLYPSIPNSPNSVGLSFSYQVIATQLPKKLLGSIGTRSSLCRTHESTPRIPNRNLINSEFCLLGYNAV